MTISKKSKSSVNVGVDVGKDTLDICIHERGIHWQEPNTNAGVRNLLNRLARYQVERLVMEATGRYQFLLAEQAYLGAAGMHRQTPVDSTLCRRDRAIGEDRQDRCGCHC